MHTKNVPAFRSNWIAGVVIVVLLALLPFVLGGFGRTGQYWIWVCTEMLIMALFALSLNLILGYGGMVSFGHAAFFGIGAYTVALLMKKAEWPLYMALLAAPIVAALLAAIIGWFCVRLMGLYFAILTLAFGQLLFMVVFQWRSLTGGDDGIHGIPRPAFLGPTEYYLLCLAVFVACFLIIRMIVNSSFGITIRTIRENSERAKFLGINVRRYQLINFIIAGAFAGVSGGLLADLNKFAQTDFLHWSKSAEPIFASLVGGMYTLSGPAIGAAILIFLKVILQQLHRSLVEGGAIILGAILLVVVLFAPGGFADLYQKLSKRSQM